MNYQFGWILVFDFRFFYDLKKGFDSILQLEFSDFKHTKYQD